MRVLYVDDESDIREIARLALEIDPEMIVETAATGADALALAPSFAPDLILLDVMMPDMDGLATLTRLRAGAATRQTPVIFITARTQATEIHRFKQLGAMAVIPKPFDPMQLAAQVRALMDAAGSAPSA
ncbi:response regulator [Hansschlegelia sp.]|uniref:response regulator n=1 Tax=Hansschlegelia sp. TaxID=2041892 RepID=UPI002C51C0D8|nr:response regulator [Hansschlegelia sp.]HVI29312.1 response regulator [Hansschlegelia sp.]